MAFLLTAAGAAGSPAVAAGPRAQYGRAPVQNRAPFGDYVDRLSFDVASVDPALVTAAGPATVTITGTMTNKGPEELTDPSYRFQRGPALGDEAAVRQELATPSEPSARVPTEFTPLTGPIAAGAAVPFSFTVSITDNDGLAITAPGVYPLMVNINGAVTLAAGPLEARIGELHLLLTVTGVPGTTVAPTPGTPGTTTARPIPVNFVWPLVDRPHLGVGGVFLDDDLLTAIRPGGRLATLLDGLTDPAAGGLPANALTIVMDPQLLDELDRMTSAYRVVATPGAPQPSMTDILQAEHAPVSSASSTPPSPGALAATQSGTGEQPGSTSDPGAADIPGTVAGTGQDAAASFLVGLRGIAARFPVLLLPYGDPDVVALVRAGLVGEVDAAVQHGTDVGRRVLGAAARLGTTTAYPINGAVDGATMAALHGDGMTSALLAENSVEPAGRTAGAALVTAPGDAAGGATGDSAASGVPSVIARPDVLSGMDALIDQGPQSGWAMRVNALTGVLAQQSLDGSVTPAVFTPDRRWSPDAPGLRVLTGLLTTLGSSQLIAAIPLADLAASATVPASPSYPEQARSVELSAGYLDRIGASRLDVASLRQTLGSTKQTSDPALVLDPLDLALDAAASTAFRQDPAVGEANLATVQATTAGIRGGVEISSAGTSYTLASSTSPLVLTVQNTLPYDVPVRVEITGGERVGLTVNDPEVHVVPAGRSQQVKIPAQVSRSGQFQVSATLVGADGTPWGHPVQLSVESTAYGALTVVIIIVAGGVLVLMVALRIGQRMRARRARLADEQAPAEQPAGEQPAGGQTPGEQTPRPAAAPEHVGRQQVGTDRP